MMKPRVTVCTRADGTFEILLNEAGRDLMMKELHRLDSSWDHFHLDYYADAEIADATDVALCGRERRVGGSNQTEANMMLRRGLAQRRHWSFDNASRMAWHE